MLPNREHIDFDCSRFGNAYSEGVKVIKPSVLADFWREHPDAEQPLKAWLDDAESAEWSDPIAVKKASTAASILKSGRVVFDIKGNDFRLVVWIQYEIQLILIKFIGTHAEYDKIDADTVGLPEKLKKGNQ